MDEQKYVCPNCNGLVDYGSKFCPHCRYEFGEWGAATNNTENIVTDSAAEEVKPKGTKMAGWAKMLVLGAVLFGAYQAYHAYITPDSAAEAVIEAFADESLEPVELYYDDLKENERYGEMCLVANAFLETGNGLTETPQYYTKIRKIFSGLDIHNYPEMVILKSIKTYYNDRADAFYYLYNTGSDLLSGAEQPKIYGFIQDPKSVVKHVDGYVVKKSGDSYLVYDYFGFGFWRRDAIPDVSKVVFTLKDEGLTIDEPGVYNFDVVDAGTSHITNTNGFEYDVPEYRVLTGEEKEKIRNCRMLIDDFWYKSGQYYFDELNSMKQGVTAAAAVYEKHVPEVLTFGDGFTAHTDVATLFAKYGDYKIGGQEHRPIYILKNMGIYYNPVLGDIIDSIQMWKGTVNSLGVVPLQTTKAELIEKIQNGRYYYSDRNYGIDVFSPDGTHWFFRLDNDVVQNISTWNAPDSFIMCDYYRDSKQTVGVIENKLYSAMNRDEFLVRVKHACEE